MEYALWFLSFIITGMFLFLSAMSMLGSWLRERREADTAELGDQ